MTTFEESRGQSLVYSRKKESMILMFLVQVLQNSCLPIFDSMEQMRIVNRTCDTILIGSAKCNNIDSIKWLLECWWTKYDSTWNKNRQHRSV